MRFWRELSSSCLQGKHFTNGATSPDPKADFDLDRQRSNSTVSILFSHSHAYPTPRHPSFPLLLKSSCCSLKTPRELQSWCLPIAFLCLWNAPASVFTAGVPGPPPPPPTPTLACSSVRDPGPHLHPPPSLLGPFALPYFQHYLYVFAHLCSVSPRNVLT